MVAWLHAFIDGQQSAESDQIVHRYLDTAQIEPDTRLNILQARVELDLTVKIREKYVRYDAESLYKEFSVHFRQSVDLIGVPPEHRFESLAWLRPLECSGRLRSLWNVP